MKEFIDETAENQGTPINRKNMMAMQGFIASTITFTSDGVRQVNSDNHILTTRFNSDGSITETFQGEKTITKTSTINADGTQISGVVKWVGEKLYF